MCWFSSPKMESPTPNPTVTPSPEPAPSPAPTPTAASPTEKAAAPSARRRKLERLRAGMLSTIKTSPQGITGGGSDLNSGQGKKTLGS